MTKTSLRRGAATAFLLASAFFAFSAPSLGQDIDEDEFEGLVAGPGQEEVLIYCSACHSTKIVQQQGLSRGEWAETLEWMIEDQGMSEIDEPDLTLILNYLAKNYNVDRPNFPKN
jgi:mono/diheme cytochrome c family protein